MMGWWWPGNGQDIGHHREKYPAPSPDKEEPRLFGNSACFGGAFYFVAWHCEANKGVSSATCKDLLSSLALVFTSSGSRKQSSNWFSGRAGSDSLCQDVRPLSWWQWGDGDGVTSGNWTQSDTSNHEHDFFQEPNLWMDNQFRRDSVWVSWKA